MLRVASFNYRFYDYQEKKAWQTAMDLADLILLRYYSDVPLSQIRNDAFWLGLYLINHPRYTEFVCQCSAYEVVKFKEEVIYVCLTGPACFGSLADAYRFLLDIGRLRIFPGFSLLLSKVFW
jgi:hypothetical protein